MKKGLLVVSIAAVVIAVLGLAGYAVAQGRTVLVNREVIASGPTVKIGPGEMMRGYGMMLLDPDDVAKTHQYMINAVAKALDMTPEELQTQMNSGTTPWQIAQKKGMTEEEFQKAMTASTAEALKQAVADEVLTQAQADQMSTRMPGWGFGFGMYQDGFPMMGPGGRRNYRP